MCIIYFTLLLLLSTSWSDSATTRTVSLDFGANRSVVWQYNNPMAGIARLVSGITDPVARVLQKLSPKPQPSGVANVTAIDEIETATEEIPQKIETEAPIMPIDYSNREPVVEEKFQKVHAFTLCVINNGYDCGKKLGDIDISKHLGPHPDHANDDKEKLEIPKETVQQPDDATNIEDTIPLQIEKKIHNAYPPTTEDITSTESVTPITEIDTFPLSTIIFQVPNVKLFPVQIDAIMTTETAEQTTETSEQTTETSEQTTETSEQTTDKHPCENRTHPNNEEAESSTKAELTTLKEDVQASIAEELTTITEEPNNKETTSVIISEVIIPEENNEKSFNNDDYETSNINNSEDKGVENNKALKDVEFEDIFEKAGGGNSGLEEDMKSSGSENINNMAGNAEVMEPLMENQETDATELFPKIFVLPTNEEISTEISVVHMSSR